jgi:hypothetical protein
MGSTLELEAAVMVRGLPFHSIKNSRKLSAITTCYTYIVVYDELLMIS